MKHKINTLILLGIFWLILWQSNAVCAGASQSIALCCQILIPTLFTPLVFSKWIAQQAINTPPAFKRAVTIVCGLTGGYLAGLQTYQTAYPNKHDSAQAGAALFCAGPAFCIQAVGNMIFHSVPLGVAFYLSSAISCLIVYLVFKGSGNGSTSPAPVPAITLLQSFILAVQSATRAMCTICAFTVCFGILTSLIQTVFPLASPFLPLLEVSTGCSTCPNLGLVGLYIAAFLIGFGGVSILLQCLYFLSGSVSPVKLIQMRVFSGIVCIFLFSIFFRFVPQKVAQTSAPLLAVSTAQSAIEAIFLLLFCVSCMCDIYQNLPFFGTHDKIKDMR